MRWLAWFLITALLMALGHELPVRQAYFAAGAIVSMGLALAMWDLISRPPVT